MRLEKTQQRVKLIAKGKFFSKEEDDSEFLIV
jgi:hypothetical protein